MSLISDLKLVRMILRDTLLGRRPDAREGEQLYAKAVVRGEERLAGYIAETGIIDPTRFNPYDGLLRDKARQDAFIGAVLGNKPHQIDHLLDAGYIDVDMELTVPVPLGGKAKTPCLVTPAGFCMMQGEKFLPSLEVLMDHGADPNRPGRTAAGEVFMPVRRIFKSGQTDMVEEVIGDLVSGTLRFELHKAMYRNAPELQEKIVRELEARGEWPRQVPDWRAGARDTDWKRGEMVPGKGIFLGTDHPWIKGEDSQWYSLGVTFNYFSDHKDLPRGALNTPAQVARHIGRLRNWHGHDGFDVGAKGGFGRAVQNGRYNGQWFLPAVEELESHGHDKLHLMRQSLRNLRDTGDFAPGGQSVFTPVGDGKPSRRYLSSAGKTVDILDDSGWGHADIKPHDFLGQTAVRLIRAEPVPR